MQSGLSGLAGWLDHYSLNSRASSGPGPGPLDTFHQSISVSPHPPLSPLPFCPTFSHLSLSLQLVFTKYLTSLMPPLNASPIRCSGLSGYFAKTRSRPDAVAGEHHHHRQPCTSVMLWWTYWSPSSSGGQLELILGPVHALVNQWQLTVRPDEEKVICCSHGTWHSSTQPW